MWKSFFLAIGVTMIIVGFESLFIEKATLTDRAVATNNVSANGYPAMSGAAAKDIVPPEWAPWSLMSAGAVIILYSFSIPRRVAG